MSTVGFAAFLDAMGHRVVEHAGVFWFDVHPRIYSSFPFQKLVTPAEVDVEAVLKKGGIALRFPCPLDCGRPSYQIVVDDSSYDFPSLHPRKRTQTRRGLERCLVRPLAFDELEATGVRLHRETLQRQKRRAPRRVEQHWLRYFRQAARTEGAEAWGAFVENDLAAYLVAFRMDGVAHILVLRSAPSMLSHYPNNALVFRYIQSVLREADIREVSYGFEPIQGELRSLTQFKTGMGFILKPVGQRVEFSPWLGRLLRTPVGSCGRWLAESRPGDERLAKLAGLLRWYNEQERRT